MKKQEIIEMQNSLAMKEKELTERKRKLVEVKSQLACLQREHKKLQEEHKSLKEKYNTQSRKLGGLSRAFEEKQFKLKDAETAKQALLHTLEERNLALCEIDRDRKRAYSKSSGLEFAIILFKEMRWWKRVRWALQPSKFFDSVLSEDNKEDKK